MARLSQWGGGGVISSFKWFIPALATCGGGGVNQQSVVALHSNWSALQPSGGCTTRTGYFKCREVKTGFYRNKSMQTGSSGTLIGWKSGQTTFVPLWDRMEGAWLRTRAALHPFVMVADRSSSSPVEGRRFESGPSFGRFVGVPCIITVDILLVFSHFYNLWNNIWMIPLLNPVNSRMTCLK